MAEVSRALSMPQRPDVTHPDYSPQPLFVP
jgi:hypothetical protein